MKELSGLIELITSFFWAFVSVYVVIQYRKPITQIVSRLRTFRLKIPNGPEMEITADQAVDLAQDLLDEVDELIKDLDDQDKSLLNKVYRSNRLITVEELIPGFERDSPEHQRLRKLRDCQLIKPNEPGQWDSRKNIVIKPFGRILLKIKKEVLLPNHQRI